MKLRFAREAARQIDSVLTSLQSQSPTGARRLRARLRAAFDLLQAHSHVGRMTSRAPVRRLVVVPLPFVLFYRADADAIVVLGVRHASRRPV